MTDQAQEVTIYINPAAKGQFTETDLIGEKGGIYVSGDSSTFDRAESETFFKVLTKNYCLEAGFEERAVYLKRNNDLVDLHIEPRYVEEPSLSNGSWHFSKDPLQMKITLVWTPKKLTIECLQTIYFIDCSSPADLERRVLRRLPVTASNPLGFKSARIFNASKNTRTIRPPVRLLEWVRDNNIQPSSYDTPEDVYQTVVSLFLSVLDIVRTASSYAAFWDENKDRIKPKTEPKISRAIHSYLIQPARIKRLDVVPQHNEAGIVDFRISGNLVSGKRISTCIECKHAHNKDLINGLTSQLPTYMSQRECEYGIYCVLWFKGEHFQEPKQYANSDDLLSYLSYVRNENGLENIRVQIFDLSYPNPPSKVQKETEQEPSWRRNDNKFTVDYFGMWPPEYTYYQKVRENFDSEQ